MQVKALILVSPKRHRRCSRDAKALLTIAMRWLWSQSPCACRQSIRDSAKRAANIARVSPHPSPAWLSVRNRQRGSQIDQIYVQNRSWRVPRQNRPQFGWVRRNVARAARAFGHSQSHQTHRRCSILLTVLIHDCECPYEKSCGQRAGPERILRRSGGKTKLPHPELLCIFVGRTTHGNYATIKRP